MSPTTNPDSLTIFGHLDELRRRLIVSLLYLVAGTLIGLFFAKDLIAFLKIPADRLHLTFVFMKPTEVISVYMKAALYAGGIFAFPAICYQTCQFVRPAMGEKNVPFLPWITAGVLLFAGGDGLRLHRTPACGA